MVDHLAELKAKEAREERAATEVTTEGLWSRDSQLAFNNFLGHAAELKAKEARAERETQDATLASLAAEPPEAETAQKLAAADASSDAFFRDLFLSHSAAEREEHARRLESEPDARWIDAAFMR